MEVNKLLGKLKPFENRTVLVSKFQDSQDIIKEIIKAHAKYSAEYDKISAYFWKGSLNKTCKFIFDYLKKNVEYDIEPDTKQTVKSPSAIIAQGYGDCKHYSLFIAGILDSLRRSGKNINWGYRFANYKLFARTPHHVFVVADPKTKKEIWIDPVLEFFDNQKPYVNAVDKNFKDMALYSISGVGYSKRTFRQQQMDRLWKVLKKFRANGWNSPASPYYKRYLRVIKQYNFFRRKQMFSGGFDPNLNIQSVAGIGCDYSSCNSVGYTAYQRKTDMDRLWRQMREYRAKGWNKPTSEYYNDYMQLRNEYMRVRSTYTMNGTNSEFTGTTTIDGIGRRTRAERKARRKAKRENRRFGPNCTGRRVAKFVPLTILARKAFLLLVRINFTKLGVKIHKALQNPEVAKKIYKKWCFLGGTAKMLRDTAAKAYEKAKRKGKVSGNYDTDGMIGVALETTIATASAIIAAMVPIINQAFPGSKAAEIATTVNEVSSAAR